VFSAGDELVALAERGSEGSLRAAIVG
jgi:hypothetical protein